MELDKKAKKEFDLWRITYGDRMLVKKSYNTFAEAVKYCDHKKATDANFDTSKVKIYSMNKRGELIVKSLNT